MDTIKAITKMAKKAGKLLTKTGNPVHWEVFALCRRDIQDQPFILN